MSSVEDLKLVLDNLPEGIILLGKSEKNTIEQIWYIEYHNNKLHLFEKLCNKETEYDFIGKSFRSSFVHLEGTEIFAKLDESIQNNTLVHLRQLSVINDDGLYSYFEVKIKPLSENQVLLTIVDITDEIKLEKQLDDSAHKYAQFLEEAPLGIAGQKNGKLVFVNKEWARIYRYEKTSDAIGLNINHFFPEDIADKVQDMALRRQDGSDEPMTYEVISMRRDGTLFPARFHISQVKLLDDSFYIAFIKDISEEKEIEEKEKIKNSIENIGKVARSIVHDLNNILTVISMNLYMLENEPNLSDKSKSGVDASKEALEDASRLLKKIRSLTKHGKMDMKLLDFRKLIYKVYDSIRMTKETDVLLSVTSEGEIRFLGDELHFEQIFMIIIENSLEAINQSTNKENQIEIRIRQLSNLTTFEENQIEIEITDTGIGMNEMIQNQLFDPFFTTKSEMNHSFSQGLGMTIVYTIVVNQYNGTIDVKSRPGVGTTLCIRLPMYRKEIVGKIPTKRYAEALSLRGNEDILIVDDNPYLRRNLETGLKQLGYQINTAVDGQEAMEKLTSYSPDLIILDLLMPNMSGFDFLEKFENTNEIPIILCSGYHELEISPEILSVYPYISKPFQFEEIANYIRATIERDLE